MEISWAIQLIYCLYLNVIIISNSMNRKKGNQKPESRKEGSSEGDCSCQMADTSLEDVGDSDCSCSECLEANLMAFNQLKEQQQEIQKEMNGRNHRQTAFKQETRRATPSVSRNNAVQSRKTTKNGFKSYDRNRETRPKIQVRKQKESEQIEQIDGQFPKFSRECMNDYMRITQHRAKAYLNERKMLEKSENHKRNQLKSMIKENLQQLRFTAKSIVQSRNVEKEDEKQKGLHNFQWMHEPYYCKSRVQCRRKRQYSPNLSQRKEQIEKINKRIKEYKKSTRQKPYQCPDKCPRHHMRTSNKNISQIQQFIKKKAKQIQQQRKRQKQQQLEKQKIKQAKLRAIDLKSKQKVARSKKYDPEQERTSFHNSIDHFSTFSELKMFNNEKQEQKKRRRKIKQAMKDGKQLQEAIYENLEQDLIGDHPPIHSNMNVQSRYISGKGHDDQQWCEKIVKDARIKPPKEVKADDKVTKDKKQQKKKKQANEAKQVKKSTKNISTKDLKKQEQRRKQIEEEIHRKKQQIIQQFQKRNSTSNIQKPQAKNKTIRQQFQKQLKKQGNKTSKQHINSNKQSQYDPYKQNYKHQPTKHPTHMNAIGDPLIQQYQYHKNKARAKQLQIDSDNDIFMSSGRQLMQKKVLKV